MISFLHPGFLYAALGVAAGIIALHFIVTEQPKTGMLPTVRFFPDLPARATTLRFRLSDLLLLAIRVFTVLLVGAAFAQPRLGTGRLDVARIVAVDLSSSTRSIPEAADSALPYIRNAAAVVLFDSTAWEVAPPAAPEALAARSRALERRRAPGSIGPALIASLRAASRLSHRADSLEIVLVSALNSEERDAATLAVREEWPGRIRLVRIAGDTVSSGRAQRIRVEWADSVASESWVKRAAPDTVGAIIAGSSVLVHPFERKWRAASVASPSEPARVIARWMDGEPAVLERMSVGGGGDQCMRSVGFALPRIGDAMLRPEFVRFARSLESPCGPVLGTPLGGGDDFVTALRGPSHLAAASEVAERVTRMTPAVPWLLAAALVLALVELLVRRHQRRRDAAASASESAERAEPGMTEAAA